jgi:hypothetical protein
MWGKVVELTDLDLQFERVVAAALVHKVQKPFLPN